MSSCIIAFMNPVKVKVVESIVYLVDVFKRLRQVNIIDYYVGFT